MVQSDNTRFSCGGFPRKGSMVWKRGRTLSPGLGDRSEHSPSWRGLQGKSHSQGRARVLLERSLGKFSEQMQGMGSGPE